MKRIMILSLLISILLMSFNSLQIEAADADEKTRDKLSYAIGVSIGLNLKELGVEIDEQSLVAGLRDSLLKNNSTMTAQEADSFINSALTKLRENKSVENLAAGIKFLKENAKRKEVKTTPSGLQYEILEKGNGPTPGLESRVSVHYTGSLIDGTVFDSSVTRGTKAIFGLDQVIPGWAEGIQLMNIGAKFKFYMPSELAYGTQGAGELVGPNEVLIFEVELFTIE